MPYTHPEALVSTDWLATHLNYSDLRLLDGSFKMPGITPTAAEDYAMRHIPGAIFFDIDVVSDHASLLPHMLPSEDNFAASVGELGIDNEHLVVIYDTAGVVSATRVWWMFRAFGHDRLAVLNGGFPKWIKEGRPVTASVSSPAPRSYKARFRPERVRSKTQVMANLTAKSEQVLDARTVERFEGNAPEPWPGRRPGRMPGSLNLPYSLLGNADKTLVSAEEMEHRFREAGVGRQKPVVTSCGSGVTACVLAFALYLTGREDVAVYDGSWAEWGLPGDTPVAADPE